MSIGSRTPSRPRAARNAAVKRFEARLVAQGPKGAWTRVDVPFDVERAFGSRARVSVKGTINGFPFRSSIFPSGRGTHHLMVNKGMLAGVGAAAGDTVRVTMGPDAAPRVVTLHAEFDKALSRNKAAKVAFDALAPSHRREFAEWIAGAKRPETRAARIDKAIPMILARKRM